MSFRQALLSNINTKSYGPFVMSRSPDVAELLSFVGYNHIVIDMEHSALDVSSTVSMLRAVDAAASKSASTPTIPIVRVPSHGDAATTKRILDILRPPAGIMFPMVETAHQAEFAVSSSTYPPYGVRGCAHPFVRASKYGNDVDYFDRCSSPSRKNNDLLRIVQIESERGIENISEIGMVNGVDCIFLGPFDISCSVGKMGQFERGGEVMELIGRAETLVRETSQKKREASQRKSTKNNSDDTSDNGNDNTNSNSSSGGLILGGFRSPGRPLKEMFSEDVGYQLVAGSADLGMIQNAAKADFMEAKRAIQSKKKK